MGRLVEHAGRPFRAAAVRTSVCWFRDFEEVARVGSANVAWAYRHPDTVVVAHDAPAAVPAVLSGARSAPEAYAIRVLRDATPTGGSRWWWQCPGCDRRCGLLYLLAGRPRLACRVCHRLTYLSQRHRRRGKAGRAGRRVRF